MPAEAPTRWSELCAVLAAICLGFAPASARAADDLESRRLEIARMSPADQQELLRTQERFLALPVAEQDRLRALEAAIESDSQADRLRQVLQGYHEWLKTLTPSERGELYELSSVDRVTKIKQLMHRQQAERLHAQAIDSLTHRDMRQISSWLEEIVWQHREGLLEDMPADRRKWFAKQKEEDQRRALVYMAFQRSRRGGERRGLANIDQEQIDKLSKKLSDTAKAELAKRTTIDQQRDLVGKWILTTMIERSKTGRASRRPLALPEADVAQFFQHDLEARERDRLMGLSQGKMRDELRRMYWEHEHGEPRGGPGGPRGDGPFGPRVGPPPREKEGRPPAGPDARRARDEAARDESRGDDSSEPKF